jgi:hypothetical protein
VKDELVVVGSQAILATIEDPPEELIRSTELDVYPRNDPERAIEIDRNIGEGSRFHDTYGYYAQGVGPETIVGPAGWEGRLVEFVVAPIQKKDGIDLLPADYQRRTSEILEGLAAKIIRSG